MGSITRKGVLWVVIAVLLATVISGLYYFISRTRKLESFRQSQSAELALRAEVEARRLELLGPFDSTAADASFYKDLPVPTGIFFIRDRRIWIANIDGSGQREVSRLVADEFHWISKANRLVAHLIDSLGDHITIIDVDSGGEETIHSSIQPPKEWTEDGISPMYYYSMSVSLDGSTIAYGEDFLDDDHSTEIYRVLSKTRQRIKADYTQLSPDGHTVAWLRTNGVCVQSLGDTSQRTYHNRQLGMGAIISWSQDGSRLFFYYPDNPRWVGPEIGLRVYAYHVSDRVLKPILLSGPGQVALFLCESHDGQIVYLAHFRHPHSYQPVLAALKKIHIASGEIDSLKIFGNGGYLFDHCSLSRAGLAYEVGPGSDGTPRQSIFVVNARTRKGVRLLDHAACPQWRVAE
jgi:hypothetical protein